MLSVQTLLELTGIIEKIPPTDLDRLFQIFGLGHKIKGFLNEKLSRTDKVNLFLHEMMYPEKPGPFTGDFHLDTLKYLVDRYYRIEDDGTISKPYRHTPVAYEERFAADHKALCHYLKIDGYRVNGREILNLLAKELDEVAMDSELTRLLAKYEFSIAADHLRIGRTSLGAGNWPAANGEFRKFIEALLVGISNRLLPAQNCKTAAQAIKLLSKTASPAFLLESRNEVEYDDFKHPFVEALYKRLHPEGGHFGPSDEDDAFFRFHLVVSFAYNLLKRLDKRNTSLKQL
jgi:hypothetical protein